MEDQVATISNNRDLSSRVRAFIADGPWDADAAFNQLALDLFAFQFEHVAIYRQLCERRGLRPGFVARWSEIPTLPASAFKEFVVSSLSEKERLRVFHSSGTTEQIPSRHFHNEDSIALYEASLLPWFEQHFRPAGLSLIFLTPPPALAPHSSLLHMFDVAQRQFGAGQFTGLLQKDGSWSLDFPKTIAVLRDAILAGQPLGLLGTAFSFVHLLDYLAVNKLPLRLAAGSRIMETGGYKGRSRVVSKTELRRLLTKFLGVPDSHIVTEYGMSELSSQAYDRVAGESEPPPRIFHFPPWVRTQIVSPETGHEVEEGETGLLRVFDLANIYSVMALQTEDLAVRREGGFEMLGRTETSERRGCSLMASQ